MIYDCFTFFNELDLLDLRLRTLADVVDRFVLAEATLTQRGHPKPLFYQCNHDRFRDFEDRLIPIVVDTYPENPAQDPWVFERHQRNALAAGLGDAVPGDVALISDVDEIPAPEKIRERADKPGISIFDLRLYYYYLNYELLGDPYAWSGARPAMTRIGRAPLRPQDIRDVAITLCAVGRASGWRVLYNPLRRRIMKLQRRVTFVSNGGWHFSYVGGPNRIATKLGAIAEGPKAISRTVEAITSDLEAGQDIFGRGLTFEAIPIDERLPAPLAADPARYAALLRG